MREQWLKLLFLFGVLAVSLSPIQSLAFSFEDLEKLEQLEREEQAELLQHAKKAARNWRFSQAKSLIEQAQRKAYAPTEIKAAKKLLANEQSRYRAEQRRKAEARERERQQQLAQQNRNSGSSSVYITSWGHDFSGGDRIWGRTQVTLNNGTTFYTWLEKANYGMRCYSVHLQGGLWGGGSNCSNSLNHRWSASCVGGSQFWVDGSHTSVVEAIVQRCAD